MEQKLVRVSEQSRVPLKMKRLGPDLMETHWYLLIIKCLALLKTSNWDYLVAMVLTVYLEIGTE